VLVLLVGTYGFAAPERLAPFENARQLVEAHGSAFIVTVLWLNIIGLAVYLVYRATRRQPWFNALLGYWALSIALALNVLGSVGLAAERADRRRRTRHPPRRISHSSNGRLLTGSEPRGPSQRSFDQRCCRTRDGSTSSRRRGLLPACDVVPRFSSRSSVTLRTEPCSSLPRIRAGQPDGGPCRDPQTCEADLQGIRAGGRSRRLLRNAAIPLGKQGRKAREADYEAHHGSVCCPLVALLVRQDARADRDESANASS
jgi:hypothetical protein